MIDTCLELLTNFPKLETATTGGDIGSHAGLVAGKVLRYNGEDKSRLYSLWKKDLGIDDESKLSQIIFLN